MANSVDKHALAPEFFSLHLVGGGADIACGDCLPVARTERQDNEELVDVSRTDATGEHCGWCGIEGE